MLVKRIACLAFLVGLVVACNQKGEEQRQETPLPTPSQAPVASPGSSLSPVGPVAVSDGAADPGEISTKKKTKVPKAATSKPMSREAKCRSACPGQPVEMTHCYCVCMGECPADEE